MLIAIFFQVSAAADPIACLRCFSVLQLFHTLHNNALNTEKTIQNYTGANLEKNVFTMADVFQKNKVINSDSHDCTMSDTEPEVVYVVTDSNSSGRSASADREIIELEHDIVKEDNDLLDVKAENHVSN